jgi:hypothetical protein
MFQLLEASLLVYDTLQGGTRRQNAQASRKVSLLVIRLRIK